MIYSFEKEHIRTRCWCNLLIKIEKGEKIDTEASRRGWEEASDSSLLKAELGTDRVRDSTEQGAEAPLTSRGPYPNGGLCKGKSVCPAGGSRA